MGLCPIYSSGGLSSREPPVQLDMGLSDEEGRGVEGSERVGWSMGRLPTGILVTGVAFGCTGHLCRVGSRM